MKTFTTLISGLLLTCGLFLSHQASAQQYWELGIMAGDMPYRGDLSEDGIDFVRNWNTFGGGYLRYRPISRVGLRLNAVFGRVDAERRTTVRISDTERANITRNFRSPITEFGLAAEFDLLYIGDPEDYFIAPYLMGGIGHTSFNPESQRDGIWHETQPLRTEAQGNLEGNYAATGYSLNSISWHFGGGVRAKLSEVFVFGAEISGRVAGTDYLDDVGSTRVNYLDVRTNDASTRNALAAYFSNPGVDPDADIAEDFVYQRGGAADDYYFLINLTLGIRLGGWNMGGGNGCYSF